MREKAPGFRFKSLNWQNSRGHRAILYASNVPDGKLI